MTEPGSVGEGGASGAGADAGATGGEGGGAGGSQAGGGEGTTPELKHSDADLDKYKGFARIEGRQTTINDLLAKAEGAQSIDDLVVAWQEKRTIEEATKGETEREKEAREAAEKRASTLESTLKQERIDARLEAAMRDAGVPSDRIEDSLVIARGSEGYKALEVGEDRKVQGLDDLVKSTLEPRSWLTAGGQQTYNAPDATPQTPQNLDFANMSDEEIQKLADRVARGETIPTVK